MDYPIQEGDAPVPRMRGARPRKYPFHELEARQFFFVPGAKGHTMMSLASTTGRRLSRKFQTRQLHMRQVNGQWKQCEAVDNGAIFGVAVYRVE